MTKNGITQYQIKDLRDDVDGLKLDMKKVMENHLPHIHEELKSLKTRVDILSLINVGAIIAGILITKYL